MKNQTIVSAFAVVAIAWSGLGTIPVVAQSNDDEGVEVLTRGPVHEAFAATVSYDPEPGIIVEVQPPEAIEELPPEQQPEGDNVVWIPGYWAWDEDGSDFIWISGIWRDLPPDRQWVPGYWAELEGGRYQWTSGYWEDTEATEVTYLPAPPRTVEVGPNIEAPSEDHHWVPGTWIRNDERYVWRTGYWAPVRVNWVWVPAYYRWTHRGYVFVDGYWDYPVARRGVLFAPARFHRGYYVRTNAYYTPFTVVNVSIFVDHLFVRPRYCHYYFGDYYAPRYHDHGFFASFSYHSGHRGCDPIYDHYRWMNRHDRYWERARRDRFEFLRANEAARPPRTWTAFNARSEAERRRGGFERYDRFVENREGGRRFRAVSKQDRERLVEQRQEVRRYARERQAMETRGERVKGTGNPDRTRLERAELKRSPLAAAKGNRARKEADAPPPRLQTRASERSDGKARVQGTGGKADSSRRQDNAREDRQRPDGAVRRGYKDGPARGNGNARENRSRPDGAVRRGDKDGPARGNGNARENRPRPDGAVNRNERPERAQQPQRRPQPERAQQPQRRPQPERAQQPQRRPQPERAQQPQRKPQPERAQQPQRRPQPERAQQPQRRPQPERVSQPQRQSSGSGAGGSREERRGDGRRGDDKRD